MQRVAFITSAFFLAACHAKPAAEASTTSAEVWLAQPCEALLHESEDDDEAGIFLELAEVPSSALAEPLQRSLLRHPVPVRSGGGMVLEDSEQARVPWSPCRYGEDPWELVVSFVRGDGAARLTLSVSPRGAPTASTPVTLELVDQRPLAVPLDPRGRCDEAGGRATSLVVTPYTVNGKSDMKALYECHLRNREKSLGAVGTRTSAGS